MAFIRSINRSGMFADAQQLLRVALRLDAVVTGANGLAYLALAGPLESLLGLDAAVGRAIGAFLLVYAVAVWIISRPAVINRWAATAVAETNAVWAVLSLIAVVTGWLSLSVAGGVWAVMQAMVVAGFAGLQYVALRKNSAGHEA